MPTVAWAITGAGHFLAESVEIIRELGAKLSFEVYLSAAGGEVLSMYRLQSKLDAYAKCVEEEAGHSFPCTGKFYGGKYSALVLSPATGNTVSKCALGIADSLVSNLFAQAGKCRVPICALPTDIAPEVVSLAPNGESVRVYPREIDLRRTKNLGRMKGVTVVSTPEEVRLWLVKSFL